MKKLEAWKKYGQEFLTISGWLLSNLLLTADQEAAYYWHGIHKDLCQLIETWYYTQHPNATHTKAIPMIDVNKIAGHHFARFRFDRNLVDSDTSDSEGSESKSESDSSSESDDESSESKDEHKSRRKSKKSTEKVKEKYRKEKAKKKKRVRKEEQLTDGESQSHQKIDHSSQQQPLHFLELMLFLWRTNSHLQT